MKNVFHVGEYLSDELEARGWSTRDCAERMGGTTKLEIDIDHLTLDMTIAAWLAPDDHCAKETVIGEETAAKLGAVFGTGAEVWLKLEAAYHAGRESE